MNIAQLPSGRVLKREVINGKHQKHIIVKVVRSMTCDFCGKECKDKVIQTQTTGNVRIATCCMTCGVEKYGTK